MNCLDSSFIVDFLDSEQDHHDEAVDWLRQRSDESFATPAICAFELLRGSVRAGDERFERAVGYLRTLTVLEFDLDAAIRAGTLAGDLHADGPPLGALDTFVASAAREHGYTLVTRNGDFQDVPGLDVTLYTR